MSAYWRGVLLDDRSAAMMAEVARLTGPTVEPSQGSYSTGVSASAGTHSGGGAIDLAAEQLNSAQRDELVAAMRQVGWAAWLRTPAQGFSYHVHGIAVDCPDLAPAAAAQVRDYFAGRNGLASRAPDDGPRDWVGVTWETYQQKPKPTPLSLEDDMPTLVLAPSRPAVWVIGSTQVAQSGTDTIRKTAGPDIPMIEMTTDDFDKWQREGVAPTLPNQRAAGYVVTHSSGTGYLMAADLSTRTVLAGPPDRDALIAAGVPTLGLSDAQIDKATQIG